jgi:hypothetical protein
MLFERAKNDKKNCSNIEEKIKFCNKQLGEKSGSELGVFFCSS